MDSVERQQRRKERRRKFVHYWSSFINLVLWPAVLIGWLVSFIH
jgi:hypothetical protein